MWICTQQHLLEVPANYRGYTGVKAMYPPLGLVLRLLALKIVSLFCLMVHVIHGLCELAKTPLALILPFTVILTFAIFLNVSFFGVTKS